MRKIIITGAAGFIGSCMAATLNAKGESNLILIDKFDSEEKKKNLHAKKYFKKVDRNIFPDNIDLSAIDFIIHLGARTDTTEFDYNLLKTLNYDYSRKIWNIACKFKIPLIYASSAATYGAGEYGYIDNENIIEKLQPLNPYGISKNEFDKWVLQQKDTPPFWAGLKFFNVYGPNEYHKNRMASVIFHAFNQIVQTGKVKLFKSYKSAFLDGEQLRDFIYVKDIIEVIKFMMNTMPQSGIYNVGTGNARTFFDLVMAVFDTMGVSPDIEFIDMPDDIKNTYQYHTEADMNKLANVGYSKPFAKLEVGVSDYVKNYLLKKRYF